ncbi:hypothetical protein A2V49_02345 [candidate division WWE3 bacterium RBG_19FT_COMBO_34_6]|uniref:Uncharacterized protein n=1 Tax=candidate division WWE3 bacterium RBG_19FT_COMBO_34_6 TaxID=1802612 RepID=A0A1F4UKF7_UNCKA|nr:MAG: hypothetical protein A2V49_02345 [candidate division WWE3 bacterium RBG_19FT_COMBO_34_6]
MQNNFLLEKSMMDFIFKINSMSTILNLFLLIITGFYLFFGFLVVRQVKQLNSSFETDSSEILSLLSYAHFLATLALMVFILISLI